MRSRKYIIYALILIVLAGYYAYFEVYLNKKKQQQEEKDKSVFSVLAKDIDQIKVTRIDEGEIVLVREGTDWSITKPVQAGADKTEVEGLLNQIEKLKRERLAGENVGDVAQYGLTEPKLKVAFHHESKWSEIQFGDVNPVSNDIYARQADEDKVFLIAAGAYQLVDKSLFNLRDKRIFTVQSDQVDGVDVKKGQFHARLELAKEGKDQGWRLVGNEGFRVKKDKVEDFIRNLGWLRVSAFEDETDKNVSTYGLDKPNATVTLKQGEVSQTMILGASRPEGGGIYAKLVGKPGVTRIEERYFNEIPGEVRAFEDRSLFAFEEDQVQRMVWKLSNNEYELKRVKEDWIFVRPQELKDKKVEPWKANYVSWKLKTMEFSSEAMEPEIAGSQTAWSVMLSGAEDRQIASLVCLSGENPTDSSKEGLIKVQTQGGEKAYKVDGESLNEIEKKIKELGEIEKNGKPAV